MNRQFRDAIWRASFKPTDTAVEVESRIRSKFGLESRYEAAQLAVGRSLAEAAPPAPVPSGTTFGKTISGEFLFGDNIDLWISLFIVDGRLGSNATADDFRALVEAHWARGAAILKEELEQEDGNAYQLLHRLAGYLPTTEGSGPSRSVPKQLHSEVRIKLGSVSRTYPANEPVELILNEKGSSPHIAFMGKIGSGKTTTAIQMANEIIAVSGIPFLFIDPKGEFVESGSLAGRLADMGIDATPITVGQEPIPLDFLPSPDVGSVSIPNAAMQFRDSIALCCHGCGNIQQDLLRIAIEKTIRAPGTRTLETIKAAYRTELEAAGKGHDSIMGRLNELTSLECFSPEHRASEFFSRSWVLALNALGTEELKRLVILLVLDALKNWLISQPDTAVTDGYRTLRHLLFIDEARRILAQKRYQSLVDIVRQGRSKGSAVMLLSQDPSDFEGQADDFTTQLGTVVAFACAQSHAGLRALQGVYGRKVQSQEFSDTFLPRGVAFAKLPGRTAERIKCWE